MAKSTYVDGFVFAVPKSKTAEYRKMAEWGKKMWMKHGAIEYKECMGEDLNPKAMAPGPQPLRFTKLAKAKPSETVWFSFITFKSRAHRDQVNKRVMAEMGKDADKYKDMPMPFDVKRMAYGGFKVIVSN